MRQVSASVLLAPAVIVAIFSTALVGIDRLGFRDVSHFYTPLFQYIGERQQATWIPLWNELDHTGIPLAGETTTAVFYPIRALLYQLPIEPNIALAWYVCIHLIIASITAWKAARWHGASTVTSTAAALTYSLSGSVFFLHTNLPFLVGAAWLPLALSPMLCSHPILNRRRVVLVGFALAMMILGGDPQTALHACLVLFLTRSVQLLRKKSTTMRFSELLKSLGLACALAAPQIAASLDWSLQSDRTQEQGSFGEVLNKPLSGDRRNESFAFSLPPWHLLEMFSPNPFGSLYPVNQRMSQRLTDDGRMWTPTIYMGLLIGLSLLTIKDRWRFRTIDRWFLLSLIGLFAAFGSFGCMWLIQTASGFSLQRDGAAGGLYWLLYWIIPGYDSFRYPAKWLPFFAIGLAISTARLLDRPSAVERIRRLLTASTLSLFVIMLATWAAFLSWELYDRPMEEQIPKDEFWGPLQIREAWWEITQSFFHSSLVALTMGFVFWLRTKRQWTHQSLQVALVIVLVVDISYSAHRLVLRIPIQQEQRLIKLAQEKTSDSQARITINNAEAFRSPTNQARSSSVKDPQTAQTAFGHSRWLRTRSGSGWPNQWRETGSAVRKIEVETSTRLGWFGRWHLADRQAVFNSMTSIRSANLATFWRATQRINKTQSPTEQARFWLGVRKWLSIDGVMTTASESVEHEMDSQRYLLASTTRKLDKQAIDSNKSRPSDSAPSSHHEKDWTHDPGAQLVAWPDWKVIAEETASVSVMMQRLKQIQISVPPRGNPNFVAERFDPTGVPVPWVITAKKNQSAQPFANPKNNSVENNTISTEVTNVSKTDESASFEINTTRKTLLTRAVYQDGNWKATFRRTGEEEWSPLTVHSVDYLKQGIIIPRGRYEVKFRYQPWWLPGTLVIACIAWAGLAYQVPKHRRKTTQNPV